MKEPSPSPFHLFFCSSSNFRAVTRLETLATQATKYKNQLMNEILLNTINDHYDPRTKRAVLLQRCRMASRSATKEL